MELTAAFDIIVLSPVSIQCETILKYECSGSLFVSFGSNAN